MSPTVLRVQARSWAPGPLRSPMMCLCLPTLGRLESHRACKESVPDNDAHHHQVSGTSLPDEPPLRPNMHALL